MRQAVWVALFLVAAGAALAGIPDPRIYRWGKLKVPENHDQPDGPKIQLYWEKLTSTSPNPQTIVMINGGPGGTHESFHKFNDRGGLEKDNFHGLRDHFEIYYFDQRGNGNSSPLSFRSLGDHDLRLYGTTAICRDIEELRRQVIRKDRIAVFGESYGGMVALSYAILFPDSVSRLVIHDSAPSNRYFTNLYQNFSNQLANLDAGDFPGIRQHFRATLQRLEAGTITTPGNAPLSPHAFLSKCLTFTYSYRGLAIMAKMVRELADTGRSKVLNAVLDTDGKQKADSPDAGPSPTLLSIQALEMLDEEQIGRLQGAPAYGPWNLAWASENMFRLRRDFRRDAGLGEFIPYDVTDRLAAIKAPTLVVVGKCDFVCPPVYARAIQKGIGNGCRLLEVDQAAHGAFDEQQDFTVSAIKAFLLPDRHFADAPPPARLVPGELQQSLRYGDVVESYLEGTRRLQGILGGH